MLEKRKVARFDLRVRTMLRVHRPDAEPGTMGLLSRDISSAGIFLLTETPLPIGTAVDLTMSIVNERSDVREPKTLTLNNSGTVVRTSGRGMAIRFSRQSRLT